MNNLELQSAPVDGGDKSSGRQADWKAELDNIYRLSFTPNNGPLGAEAQSILGDFKITDNKQGENKGGGGSSDKLESYDTKEGGAGDKFDRLPPENSPTGTKNHLHRPQDGETSRLKGSSVQKCRIDYGSI